MLIDFSDNAPAPEPTKPSKTEDGDEFDMFAQTRSSTFADSRRGGSTYEDNISNVPTESFAGIISKSTTEPEPEEKTIDDEIEDVEEWLKDTDLNKLVSTKQAHAQDTSVAAPLNAEQERPERQQQQQQQGDQSLLTSEEFDRFLAERSFA